MEKIPEACAMDWSIELDKGLRSKLHGIGKSIEETMTEVGHRLERWNREPPHTMAVYSMFGLIPGEEKLFANAILLRLADSFISGDKRTKLCVVKLFLSVFKQRKINRRFHKRNEGILSNCMVDNMELLRRVKMGFDSEDVEVRALTLVLFGCWADFAKDIAEIRYLILSSAVSSHVLEVKASLFAAGCFCELSDDFASVFLEILVNILSSSEISVPARLAGAHALAKLGCSSSLAKRAHEIGLKLIRYSAEEDFSIAMLISLSKVSSKSAKLISGQVNLLLSYLTQERTPHVRATSLKCLHFISVKRACHLPITTDEIYTLFNVFGKAEFPPTLQLEVLQILYKILLYKLPSLGPSDMLECFTKILTIAETVMQSPIISNRLSAIQVLAEISWRFMGRMGMALDGVGFTMASQAILFVMDRISLMAKLQSDLHQPGLELDLEVRSLLSLIRILVEECPELCGFVLDKIYLFIDYLVNKDNGIMGAGKINCTGHDLVEFGRDNRIFTTSNLVLYLSKVAAFSLKNLDKTCSITPQVQSVLKLLDECMHRCSLFDGYLHTIYSLLLHPHIAYHGIVNETDENYYQHRNLNTSDCDDNARYEMLILEGAMKILAGKNYWSAYKAGKCAAAQGAWFTAAFIFRQLITMVQSDSCHCWLNSLHLFAYSEMIVQYLNSPKARIVLLNWLENNRRSILPLRGGLHETYEDCNSEISSTKSTDNLLGACKFLHSSEETLGAIMVKSSPFLFQKWFLALRAKVLETVVEILNLLGTVTLTHNNISSDQQLKARSVVQGSGCAQEITSLTYSLRQMSTRLQKLARKFDLVATSFIGMGPKSSMIISALALSCSIMAFSTEFTFSFPTVRSSANCIEHSVMSFHVMLIQDLAARLRGIDHETSKQLWSLLKSYAQPRTCSISQSRAQKLENAYEVCSMVNVGRYAVCGVVGLQNEANSVDVDNEASLRITNSSLQLLFDIIVKWMNIPFRIPNHFFRIRPFVSSQLFASNRNWVNEDGIFVMSGFHLSLNLCLQLSNIPSNFQAQLTKLYCVLYCRTTFLLPCLTGEKKTQAELDYKDWESDDILELNEKLVQHVSGCTKTSGTHDSDYNRNSGFVETYVCLEPNEKGQGFSTCMLDVSAFPSGSYRIKWHSCCVDRKGSYWSLPSLNAGPVFTVQDLVLPGDSI